MKFDLRALSLVGVNIALIAHLFMLKKLIVRSLVLRQHKERAMHTQAPDIERQQKRILDAIRQIEELDSTEAKEIERVKQEISQKKEELCAKIFRISEELREYAETKRRGKKEVIISPGLFTRWYRAPSRVRELADIPSILAELRKLRLVELFMRKKTIYTVNKNAVKDNQSVLAKRNVTTLTVDEPRNLVSLSFGQTDMTVIKDLGTGQWHLSRPPKKEPKRPDKLPLPEGSF